MGGNRKYFIAAGLSGLLLALAYPGWGFDFGWLAWVGLAPLLWSLVHFISRHDHTQKQSGVFRTGFLLGFAAGLIYFLIIFRWFWSIYPLDTLGIQSHWVSFAVIFLVWLISSAGMAAFWGLFGLVLSSWFLVFSKKSENYKLQTTNYKLLLLTPALFVLLEYASSWGFGFLWAGSGSLFGSHWTLGNLAYTLADNPLILKLASYAGIYGATFAVILVNCLICQIFAGKFTRAPLARGALVTLIVTAVTLGPKLIKPRVAPQETGKQINFAVIQTAQPTISSPNPQKILAGLEEQLKLLNRISKERPESQLIVFPETSELFKNIALFMTSAQVQKYFDGLFKEPRLIIAGGRVFDADGQFYSRVFNLDTKNDIINYYDKRLLMMGGEFLPYPVKLIAWLFSKITVSQFDSLRELDIGTKDASTVNFRNQFKTAPMICSELLSPGLTKQTSQNSDVIVSMASYGVFHGSPVIGRQMLAVTRFRAVETAKPVITAANLGRSYTIDNRGNIAYLTADSTPQILTGSIVLDSRKTWYNKVGDIPILLGCLALIAILATTLLVRPKNI